MKSNFNDLFEGMLPRLLKSNEVNIDEVLDELMPLIIFNERVTKMDLARSVIRGRLTTALNMNQIYSYEKGKFIFIENANEEQLSYFMEKAKHDAEAAEARKAKAEMMRNQISLAWDDEGNFLGYQVPKAMNQ